MTRLVAVPERSDGLSRLLAGHELLIELCCIDGNGTWMNLVHCMTPIQQACFFIVPERFTS